MIDSTSDQQLSKSSRTIELISVTAILAVAILMLILFEMYQSHQITSLEKRIVMAQAQRPIGQPIDPSSITNLRDVVKEQAKGVNMFGSAAEGDVSAGIATRPSISSALSPQQLLGQSAAQKDVNEQLSAQGSKRQESMNKGSTMTP